MNETFPESLLWVAEKTVHTLLDYYDYKHPLTGKLIEGYDKPHALRTAKMCATVAQYLGHDENRVRQYQIACLLHDMGRAGLEHDLFGKIWTWAKTHNIPTRPAEWRAIHPDTTYGEETEAFIQKYQTQLETLGINIDAWAKEQVEMRLGYARRLSRILKDIIPDIEEHNIEWSAWMEKVCLYYYYPEKLVDEPDWLRELGEILVTCEQLEAYSNRTRGNDYYNREDESFEDAFIYLESLREKGQIGSKVLDAVRQLTASGEFDTILKEARDGHLSEDDLKFLRSLSTKH